MTDTIVTVTPNPVVDIATSVDELAPDRKLRCSSMHLEPGGGGVNCARVVAELGGRAHAVYAAGRATGTLLDGLLDDEELQRTRVEIGSLTRLGFHVRRHVHRGGVGCPGPTRPTSRSPRMCWPQSAGVDPERQWSSRSGATAPTSR